MVRYITWAIPSIGFIGTVRGIGDALGQAYKAVEGDISGVTVSLGVAFNSTFVALVLSIIMMPHCNCGAATSSYRVPAMRCWKVARTTALVLAHVQQHACSRATSIPGSGGS